MAARSGGLKGLLSNGAADGVRGRGGRTAGEDQRLVRVQEVRRCRGL